MTPNTSLSTAASSLPSLNRRQRSNTSPARSLSTTNAAGPSFLVLRTNNQQYIPEQQAVRLPEQSRTTATKLASAADKSSLKREAKSPVYLDQNTISLASSNNNSNESNLTRRVVQCNSSRIRSSDSEVTSISSQDENAHFHNQRSKDTAGGEVIKKRSKNHGQRNKWTKEETEALVRGCNNFAIGQWKTIRDSEPLLAKRSPGDLKDRFRTYFPDAYRQHYPNAKTHISSRVRSLDSTGNSLFGENAVRRERRQFSAEEDAALKRGYVKFGTAWSSIQRDPVLASRKATDLRDRFRNAFPDLYAAAGYKPRSRKASGSNFYELLLDPHHTRGSFDAIDLSVYSHPFRANNHLYPDQHQLPSLDFLKEHGAEAFSKLRVISPGLHTNTREDISSLNDCQAITPATTVSAHLANLTPRPDMNTPRPNDTTPRPDKRLSTTKLQDLAPHIGGPRQACSSIVHDLAKSPKTLQKAQSSMDLTQFSNLDQLGSNFLPLTINCDTRVASYSPTFTDYVDYASASTMPYPDSHFFHTPLAASNPNLGLTRTEGFDESSQSPGIGPGTMERDTHAVAEMSNTSIWVQELDNGNQTFQGTFDLNGFLGNEEILESYEDGSGTSSLASSTASVEFTNDRVAYNSAGDVEKLVPVHGPTHEFSSFSSGCHPYAPQLLQQQQHDQSQSISMTSTSPQVQERIRTSRFLNSQDLKLPMNINSSIPTTAPSHSYQEMLMEFINHDRLDQNPLSSSLNPPSDFNSPSTSSSSIFVSTGSLPPHNQSQNS